MSIARQAQPIRPLAPRRHLRPVTATVQPVRRPKAKSAVRAERASFRFPKTVLRKVIIGLSLISISGLIVNAWCDTAVYTISTLKKDTEALATQTQVVSQQVDSLRSPQNLANSAKALGMIVNSNPVFLNVKEAKVLGSAVPASVESSIAVSKNLIANAAMTVRSNVSKLTSTKTATIDAPTLKTSTTKSVKSNNTAAAEVPLIPVGIPKSPTN
jgi:cell division protein FtsL